MWVCVGLVPDQQAVGGTNAASVEAESTDVRGGGGSEPPNLSCPGSGKTRGQSNVDGVSLLCQGAVFGSNGEVMA